MRICESESAKTAMAAVTDAATQGETKDISGSKLNGQQDYNQLRFYLHESRYLATAYAISQE